MTGAPVHKPVLLREAVDFLDIRPGGTYADLTLGLGGHSLEILERLQGSGRLIGVDKDPDAIEIAKSRLSGFGGVFSVIHSDFRLAPEYLRDEGVDGLDGFIMDLGVSTMQLKTPERGFGFRVEGPLDMRMDPGAGEDAAGLVNRLDADELATIIKQYGEERRARSIAMSIVRAREIAPITKTDELATIIERTIPRKFWPKKLHPATRTFQALRIAVNDELGALKDALDGMLGMLNPGGRAVVISYHSLEDRLVKDMFREWAKGCTCPPKFPICICHNEPKIKILTRKPVVPEEGETDTNPSARSAKLRVAEKL
jgi:16S rRNA (cytosine1402-N4)-methyltransferase